MLKPGLIIVASCAAAVLTGATLLPEKPSADYKSPQSGIHYVKPGAAIEISHNYDGQTVLGEIETVTIHVSHGYESGYLSLKAVPSTGLFTTGPMQSLDYRVSPNSKHSLDVQFFSRSTDVEYFNIEAIYENEHGQILRRNFALAISPMLQSKSGKIEEKPENELSEKDGFIFMNAIETISD